MEKKTLLNLLINTTDEDSQIDAARRLNKFIRDRGVLYLLCTVAVEAIGEIGPQAKGSAPLLRPLLKHSDSFVRDAAAKALEQIERN